jgi:hypothetical protein
MRLAEFLPSTGFEQVQRATKDRGSEALRNAQLSRADAFKSYVLS